MLAENMSVPTVFYLCVLAILGAEDNEDKLYHSASHIPTPYSKSNNCRDTLYDQTAERHPRRLTGGTGRRGDKEIKLYSETKEEN